MAEPYRIEIRVMGGDLGTVHQFEHIIIEPLHPTAWVRLYYRLALALPEVFTRAPRYGDMPPHLGKPPGD